MVMIGSLVLGSAGPVFADVTAPTRQDQVTAIQTQYSPIFDAYYARFMVIKPEMVLDTNAYRTFKATLADFLDMRRIINDGLTSATSDLSALKSFAEEEAGEFGSTLSILETQSAKMRTLMCFKGKVVKKASGLTPKCPKGYKKK